jgi:hypothetical protein
MLTKFWYKSQKGRDDLDNLDVDGDNIRMDLRKIVLEVVDRIHLAEARDRWRALGFY